MAGKEPFKVCIYQKILLLFCYNYIIILLRTVIIFCFTQKKLQKEMTSFIEDPPPGMVLDASRAEQNLNM